MQKVVINVNPKYVVVNVNWETDDGKEPPKEVQKEAVRQVNLWLHEHGIEGNLTKTIKDGRSIARITFERPEDWSREQVEKFCYKMAEELSGECEEQGDFPLEQ